MDTLFCSSYNSMSQKKSVKEVGILADLPPPLLALRAKYGRFFKNEPSLIGIFHLLSKKNL